MSWLPIESAPVGVACLIFMPAWGSEKQFPSVITTAVAERPGNTGWLLCEAGTNAEDREVYPWPTHWMPLPPPPQDETDDRWELTEAGRAMRGGK